MDPLRRALRVHADTYEILKFEPRTNEYFDGLTKLTTAVAKDPANLKAFKPIVRFLSLKKTHDKKRYILHIAFKENRLSDQNSKDAGLFHENPVELNRKKGDFYEVLLNPEQIAIDILKFMGTEMKKLIMGSVFFLKQERNRLYKSHKL